MVNELEISKGPFKHYTALLRPDPPDLTLSVDSAKSLRQLADQIGRLQGFQELGRDERNYQVELHIRSPG